MKEIKPYKSGDKIPSDAKFLSSQLARNGELRFFYEVNIKECGEKLPQMSLQPKINEVIGYLNEKALTHYRPNTEANKKLLKIILKDYSIEDVKKAIDNMVEAWGSDPKWMKYLRPSTLFNKNKFDNYLNYKSNNTLEDNAFAELDRITGGN